jgi:hypothetical protein
LGPGACDKPDVGRLTGRGNRTNLEVLLNLKPDLVLDVGTINETYISLATRVQVQKRILIPIFFCRRPTLMNLIQCRLVSSLASSARTIRC